MDTRNSFACVRMMLLQPQVGKCIVGNAGNGTIPVFRHDSGSVETVALKQSVPLGMISNPLIEERCPFEETDLEIRAGDALFLYTDGLEESESSSGELFGTSRISDIIRKTLKATDDLDETIRALVREKRRHRGDIEPKSDVSILGVVCID